MMRDAFCCYHTAGMMVHRDEGKRMDTPRLHRISRQSRRASQWPNPPGGLPGFCPCAHSDAKQQRCGSDMGVVINDYGGSLFMGKGRSCCIYIEEQASRQWGEWGYPTAPDARACMQWRGWGFEWETLPQTYPGMAIPNREGMRVISRLKK